LQDILDTPRFYGLTIESGLELVGAVFGNIERWYDRNHYNLKEMFVRPDLQGSGMGSKMMTKACTELKKRNVIGVYLFTSITGGVSCFYTKNDFTKVIGMQMMNRSLETKGLRTKR
jgi:GNAT superfamily N-acetyltransferase